MDEDTFRDLDQLATAVAACGHCPVVDECAGWALEHNPSGVWAGLTERARRHQREHLDDDEPGRHVLTLARPTTLPTCGQPDGYLGHRKRAEPICDACQVAARKASDAAIAKRRASVPVTAASATQTPRTPAWIHAASDLPAAPPKEKALTSTLVPPAPAVTVAPVVAPPIDLPAPYIAALACRDLFADVTYQRDLDKHRRERMAGEYFDRTLLGVLEVSDRGDGRYAILDGQHRWAAAVVTHGNDFHVVCQVHSGLDVAGEARVFYEIDHRRKALTGWDRWKARRKTGDPVVAKLDTVAAEFGLKIGPGRVRGQIQTIGALEQLLARGGRALVHSTLAILTAAYGDDPDAYVAPVIGGVGEVLVGYRAGTNLDGDRLIATLAGIAPAQLKARAQALREMQSGTLPRLTAAVIVRAYNSRPGPNLPPFIDHVPARPKATG